MVNKKDKEVEMKFKNCISELLHLQPQPLLLILLVGLVYRV